MAKEFDMEPIDSRPSLSFKGRAFRSVKSLLDKSASPCDDFYNYACGKFPQMNPLDVNTQELTTVSIIFRKNEERFRRLLDKPPISNAVNSYDRKAKVFFSSCQDHFYRTQLGGKPLLDHVIGELPGGWWAQVRDEDWDDAAWDLTSVLRKTHVDFWTSTFFSFLLQADQLDLTKPAIQIDIWGTAMPHYAYLSPFYAKYIDDYKTFIRTVGSLLLRDASPNATDEEKTSRVEQFVNDAFEVESKIVDVKASSMRHPNPFAPEERMTLQQLSDQTSGAVDFVSLLTYMYNEAAVDGSTPVVVPEKAYLLNLTNWIKDEMAAEAKTIKRKLNNYIVWRLAHRYAQDLSWEYTTAGQQFEMDILGAKLFPSTWWYCVTKLEVFMHEAMGAMLVREHFGEANKRKAHEITDHVKTALMESLSSTLHWMSVESRNKAEQKLRDSIMKIGYPDYMMREDTLNMKFATFTVNPDTYFQNLLSSNKVLQKYINEQFTNFGKNSSVWGIPVQSQRALYYSPWKELIVPAGLLQFPIYDHTSPNYMNFGSMGSIVGTALVHAVDAEGSMFHLDGSQMGTSWWSNHTQQEYQRVRQCMVDAYSDAVQGPFGQGPLSAKIKVDMMYYTPQAFRDSSGVKLAYQVSYHRYCSFLS
nr:hypothetical protein BaRGS_034572 [Batillaria attramentaria]